MKRKHRNYWTKEQCKIEALKYKTKNEFCKNSGSAYGASLKNKWIDEICSHMIKIKHEKEYWTKEQCKNEALKYNSRTEYNLKCVSSYSKAWQNGWLDEICQHMELKGNKYKRCIYVYEFTNDNVAYIGLTYNFEQRHQQHLKKGPVYSHIKNNNSLYKHIKLTDYLDVKISRIKEKFYINKYKDDGWKLLNNSIGGAIGGGIRKWTKNKCVIDAKKYNTKKEYRLSKSYRAALRNNWLDDIYMKCGFELTNSKPHNYWNIDMCKIFAVKCETLKEFRKISNRVPYNICIRNNWLDEICKFRNWVQKT